MDTLIYTPLYNLLVLLIDLIPGLDLGIYIILFTLLVKIILLPFALKAIRAQQAIRKIEPQVKELQKKHKDNRQELGIKLMELYRENDVSPFSSFGLILVQIPIIFGLYYIVLRSGLPEIDPSRLYSFITAPETNPSSLLFGVIDVAARSIPLALLAGIAQFIQTKIALPANAVDSDATMQQQMMNTIIKQMKYVFPVVITVIAYTLSAAVALYFVTSNIFHILQELYVRSRGIKDQTPVAFDI
jgi:YidC/Oxa1 family membrane protein insertase